MAKTRKILDRIEAVKATKQITQAMKMVAVAKVGKLKERQALEQPYIDAYHALFQEICYAQKSVPLPFEFADRPVKRVLILCLTTDRGLCGAFNPHVLNKVYRQREMYMAQGIEVALLPIGKKGEESIRRRSIAYLPDYVDIVYEEVEAQLTQLVAFIRASFQDATFDQIELVYQPSKMAAKESVRVVQLLPLIPSPAPSHEVDRYEYEPSRKAVIEEMVQEVIFNTLYGAWLAGAVAEQSVRMIVTSQATDNAEKLSKEYKLLYNRTRQSAITRELTEIVAGTNATT